MNKSQYVARAVAAMREVMQRDPEGAAYLLVYRNPNDVLPGAEAIPLDWQLAAAESLKSDFGDQVNVIEFNAGAYHEWLGPRIDMQAYRLQWAASKPGLRYSISFGMDSRNGSTHGMVGWAVFKTDVAEEESGTVNLINRSE